MKTQANEIVNTQNLNDTNDLRFVKFNTLVSNNWIDVYFKGQRIAIINGLSAPLQWTAKNGSNIPIKIIEKLERFCSKNLIN